MMDPWDCLVHLIGLFLLSPSQLPCLSFFRSVCLSEILETFILKLREHTTDFTQESLLTFVSHMVSSVALEGDF